jgi:hypothetical protein
VPDSSALSIPESPIAVLGTLARLCAFAVAAYAGVAGAIGNLQHRRRLVSSAVQALYGFCALMMLASALLIYAFAAAVLSPAFALETFDACVVFTQQDAEKALRAAVTDATPNPKA